MLQCFIIGHLGGDAETKNDQGREFTAFRVAHSDRWTTADGQQREETTWVDCILGGRPAVAEYLKRGQMVAVIGTVRLRVYSSPKDKCMKAGLTISVRSVELLGGQSDEVPRRLYDTNGVQHDVFKAYYTDVANTSLFDVRGKEYKANEYRYITQVAAAASADVVSIRAVADGAAADGAGVADSSGSDEVF